MGYYMVGTNLAFWLWMCFMMFLMVIGGIVFLIALWRLIKAKESIARSVEDLSQYMKSFRINNQ